MAIGAKMEPTTMKGIRLPIAVRVMSLTNPTTKLKAKSKALAKARTIDSVPVLPRSERSTTGEAGRENEGERPHATQTAGGGLRTDVQPKHLEVHWDCCTHCKVAKHERELHIDIG